MTEEWIDKPREIRDGDKQDTRRLFSYLSEQLEGLEGEFELQQFPSGHSNLTFMLRNGSQEWVLRRPPGGAGRIKSGHDMGREYRILSKLHTAYAKVPKMVHFCEDEDILGAPFYLMERVKGVIFRSRPPKGLELTPDTMRSLSEALVDNLVELHQVDYEAAGLGELGKPAGYVERQITGWTRRYYKAQTDDIPEMEQVAKWLAENRPPESTRASLIHNDYKYDNLVLDPNELTTIRAVLDWEMATLGDPLMDLGTTLGYWITAEDPDEWKFMPFGLTTMPGNLSRSQIVERYAEKSGHDVSNILFYYVYALFKIGVIVQQIYFRYKQGDTNDPRFAHMLFFCQMLSQIAAGKIESESLD